jgi:FkbM family methyltransferase
MRRFLRYTNRVLQDILPPYAYLRLAQIGYPLMDNARRGSGINVVRCRDGLFRAELPDMTFYFDAASKVQRYMFPLGPDDIFHRIEAKYSGIEVYVEIDDVVMDVGANVGEFSVAIADKAKFVVAVEPDIKAFECLKRNTEKYKNVICTRSAAGDRNGIGEFYSSPTRSDSSLIEPTAKWVDKMSVSIKTLPTILSEHGIECVDFLKIDAEGFEPEVLLGAKSILRRIKKVAIDVSPERRGTSTVNECRKILEEAGFLTNEKRSMRGRVLLAKRS